VGGQVWERPIQDRSGLAEEAVEGDRPCQLLGDPGFGRREQPGAHSLGLVLQVGKNRFRRGLVPAPSRDIHNDPVAIAVADKVGARFVANPLGPVLGGRDGRRSELSLPVAPSSEPLALPSDDLRTWR
jgi:hypothetical protein